MRIDRIAGALIDDQTGPCDLTLAEGQVAEVIPSADAAGPGTVLRAEGRVVIPALVDAHVHLDKAFLLAAVEAEGDPLAPTVGSAIAAVAALRGQLPIERVAHGARRAIDRLIGNGVTAAR